MKKIILLSIFSFSILIPIFAYADGGIFIWPPKIYLSESAQKAICAFNGSEEVLIISNDFKSDKEAKILRIIPFPTKPEIKKGDSEVFKKLESILNEKIEQIREKSLGFGEAGSAQNKLKGVEIVFSEKIGSHDLTVVKVNNLDDFIKWIDNFEKENNLSTKNISKDFREGIESYLSRNINYFVFDVIEISGEKSVDPLVYKFQSKYLYYPLLITGASEVGGSSGKLQMFFITNDKNKNLYFDSQYLTIELTIGELSSLEDDDILSLFNSEVNVRFIEDYIKWEDFNKDIVIPPYIWKRNLRLGDKGEDVSLLQTFLFSIGFNPGNGKVTGVFDIPTKLAVKEFQEEYKYEILEPLGLKEGTGFFGPMTKNYLKRKLLNLEEEKVFNKDLYLGCRGDDVLMLQYLLKEAGYWPRNDISPTGYFGPITMEAVKKFQEAHRDKILSPLGLENPTGFVGPMTRKILEEVYNKNLIY